MAVGHFRDLVSYGGTISHDCDEAMDFFGPMTWGQITVAQLCWPELTPIWRDQEG